MATGAKDNIPRGRESNTIQDITQPVYSIPTDTHSKSLIKLDRFRQFLQIVGLVASRPVFRNVAGG
jgi:hypothetical protein